MLNLFLPFVTLEAPIMDFSRKLGRFQRDKLEWNGLMPKKQPQITPISANQFVKICAICG
jgi:hypothetical protein